MADSGIKRNIPIKLGDFSVIDTEFSNIRERFDAEMRKMEDEMSRFRSELMNRESNNFFKSTTSTTTQSTQNSSLSPPHDSAWLDGLNSPLIQDEGDSKCLKLRFDVSQYTPEEIVVKTVDNKLLVHAKHEEKTESKSVYREYNREFLLPKGTNPESIKSSLSKDGVLTVEAPLPAIGTGEKLIPIAHQ
ncbi:heat shock protein beta-1 isoform X2 [Apis laboriosa]|uniref:Heat shock protein beta-1 isoform X2 n=3 Tax=Apis TaxID=7459 RepID=A0A7M7GAK6_APIME|nr:heat shock protein beta-1 isoform X2 [Apis mellifera]XP_006615873.1 heat shock protein beta-1 isoform X2 [Apis dorsata]XP_016921822.1 heat shock protein beta-1 isoform X2 [Apis cerana]XP_043800305.1 heat shock protein beta-1 isoform X2 [Apis laboriosa]PBC32321.1 Heat shock protein beta-1 [Apis cerana cerana]|eukprot:XP_003251576.1 heat shock protein beta-1 isoform X2 [Apis mellifera]